MAKVTDSAAGMPTIPNRTGHATPYPSHVDPAEPQ